MCKTIVYSAATSLRRTDVYINLLSDSNHGVTYIAVTFSPNIILDGFNENLATSDKM